MWQSIRRLLLLLAQLLIFFVGGLLRWRNFQLICTHCVRIRKKVILCNSHVFHWRLYHELVGLVLDLGYVPYRVRQLYVNLFPECRGGCLLHSLRHHLLLFSLVVFKEELLSLHMIRCYLLWARIFLARRWLGLARKGLKALCTLLALTRRKPCFLSILLFLLSFFDLLYHFTVWVGQLQARITIGTDISNSCTFFTTRLVFNIKLVLHGLST